MKTKAKIAVIGASGRMGQELLSVLMENNFTPTGISENGKAAGYTKVGPLTTKGLSGHDIVIEFSSPEGFSKALTICKELGIPLVSGTTGLSSSQTQELKKAAKKIPILWSPNMSIGIAALKKSIAALSGLAGFDFQIEEIHHNKKKDSPSGTAVALQNELAGLIKRKVPQPISIRAGGVVGIHKVYAISNDEFLCFEHQAITRKAFASGAVRAATWLLEQPPGLYEMENVLND